MILPPGGPVQIVGELTRDIVQMSQTIADQRMLIYVLIAAYAPLVTVIGILWRKRTEARKGK